MQFKMVGNIIQVHRYEGYDKIKKRAIVKMVGSMSRHIFTPSDGLIDKLTDEEKTELQSYIEKERQSYNKDSRQSSINFGDSHIKRITHSLSYEDTTITLQQADAIWDSIAVLQKALKKRGFKKPDSQPDKVPDSRQKKFDV